MKDKDSARKGFHILMFATAVVTLAMMWANSHNWWLSNESWKTVAWEPDSVLPILVVIGLWWTILPLIRDASQPNGLGIPISQIEELTIGTVRAVIETSRYDHFLVLLQPEKWLRLHNTFENAGEEFLICWGSVNASAVPIPGKRVIAIREKSQMVLKSYPLPDERAVVANPTTTGTSNKRSTAAITS